LYNLEKQFASNNPVLQRALKVFQELDQIEFDLGLIGAEDTTASKQSWWPVISLFGGNSSAKTRFMNNYFGSEPLTAGIQAAHHKFSVLLYSSQANSVTLPATALDVDPRHPFYQVSRKIEQQEAGEGTRVNSYLELKTYNSPKLKGKLFIDAPNLMTVLMTPVVSMLVKHTIEQSDLVLVFTDALEQDTVLVNAFIQAIVNHQDSNKFIYLIEESPTLGNAENINLWQRKLAEFGLNTGHFIIMPNQQAAIAPQSNRYFAELDSRILNVGHDRSYRVLLALQKNIQDLEVVVIPEVKQGLDLWKEWVNLSSLIVLSVLVVTIVFVEIQIGGIVDLLIDPIIGPLIVIFIIAVMIPVHVFASKFYARMIANRLLDRQKELGLIENLADVFEKHLTLARMLLPFTEPVGWNKKVRARLLQLSERTKLLVQELNDFFSGYPAETSAHQEYDPLHVNDYLQ